MRMALTLWNNAVPANRHRLRYVYDNEYETGISRNEDSPSTDVGYAPTLGAFLRRDIGVGAKLAAVRPCVVVPHLAINDAIPVTENFVYIQQLATYTSSPEAASRLNEKLEDVACYMARRIGVRKFASILALGYASLVAYVQPALFDDDPELEGGAGSTVILFRYVISRDIPARWAIISAYPATQAWRNSFILKLVYAIEHVIQTTHREQIVDGMAKLADVEREHGCGGILVHPAISAKYNEHAAFTHTPEWVFWGDKFKDRPHPLAIEWIQTLIATYVPVAWLRGFNRYLHTSSENGMTTEYTTTELCGQMFSGMWRLASITIGQSVTEKDMGGVAQFLCAESARSYLDAIWWIEDALGLSAPGNDTTAKFCKKFSDFLLSRCLTYDEYMVYVEKRKRDKRGAPLRCRREITPYALEVVVSQETGLAVTTCVEDDDDEWFEDLTPSKI